LPSFFTFTINVANLGLTIADETSTNNDASEFLIKPTFTPEVEAIDQSEAVFLDLPRNLKL
jgi:hypothetical protein